MTKQQTKPKLISVLIKDTSTDTIICAFPPTKAGEKRAKRYEGLVGIKVIKQYE